MLILQPSRSICCVLLLSASLGPDLLASDKPSPTQGLAGRTALEERKVPASSGAELTAKSSLDEPSADTTGACPDCGCPWGPDLRYKDLRGQDLRRKRLAGRDLTGSKLDWANLTGVSLKNTRLFGATTFFTRGLDLTEAQVHPFFSDVDKDPHGELRWLELAECEYSTIGQPKCLASTPDFPLVYVTGDGLRQRVVSATGVTFDIELDSKARILGLAVDAQKRLVTLAEDGLRFCSIREGEAGFLELKTESCHVPKPQETGALLSMRAYPTMAVDLAFANWMMRVRKTRVSPGKIAEYPPDLAVAHALHSREGRWQIMAIKDENRLVMQSGPTRATHTLPPETTCSGLALAPDGMVWFTFTGKGGHGIGRVDPVAGGMGLKATPKLDAGSRPRELGALVALPDGRGVWYCDGGGRIGCLLLAGSIPVILEYPLPDGDHPVTLTPSFDGRLFFTVEGRSRIGSIQACPLTLCVRKADDAPAEAAAGAGAAAEGAGPETKQPRLTDAQRRERAFQNQVRRSAEATTGPEAKPEGTGEAKTAELTGGAAEATEAAPSASGKAASRPGAGARTPEELLQANQVILTQERLAYIQAKHGWDRRADKSQFAEAFSTHEALASLLAKGMNASSDTIGKIRSTTVEGTYLTLCRQPGVGYYDSGTDWEPTDWFVVVTSLSMDRAWHTVKTAYPVRPRGF
jgi:hypothetical protein